MRAARTYGGLLAAGALIAFAAPAGTAPRKTAVFQVTATHSGIGTQVTISSKVWITSTQARADVKHPLQGDMIFLVSNGFFYQLDPKSKRGIKGPLPPELKKSQDNFDQYIAKFAFDAGNVLKAARKIRTESVSGYSCDVLTSSQSKEGATRTITVWMPRQMDPKFPVKALLSDRVTRPGASIEQTVTVTLSNIRLGMPIAASVFAVPAGYKLESGSPTPPGPGK